MGIKANSYAEAEAEINAALTFTGAEEIVERMWPDHSPQRIAEHIRAIHRPFSWISARWVESIKRRIDNRRRND